MSAPAHLDGDLAGELEHLAVQQEEARQPERGDEAQLLLQARGGLGAQRRAHRVAGLEAPVADLGQLAIGLVVLGAGVAVAEVAGEVEAQGVGQALGLGDRVGVVGEAGGHGLRRGEDVAVVAAAQGLGGVERGVLADGHEGVLQPRARGRVRVDVARGHAGDAEAVGERGQAAVERAVVAVEGALQLDAEGVAPEGAQQPAHGRLVADPLARAAAEADQALGVGLDVLEGDARLAHHARGPRRRAA